MKIRYDFVTNSSSSSFVISKNVLSLRQMEIIKDHINYAKKHNLDNHCCAEDAWNVYENENDINVWTIIDNFDMYSFLMKIGVKPEDIKDE